MKKVILVVCIVLVAMLFSGCRATPSVASSVAQLYDTTKTFYAKGQEVVVINADLLDEDTIAKLNGINEVALLVDSTYTLLTAEESQRYEALEKEYTQLRKYQMKYQNEEFPEGYREKLKRYETVSELLTDLNIKAIERHSDYLNGIKRLEKTAEVIAK